MSNYWFSILALFLGAKLIRLRFIFTLSNWKLCFSAVFINHWSRRHEMYNMHVRNYNLTYLPFIFTIKNNFEFGKPLHRQNGSELLIQNSEHIHCILSQSQEKYKIAIMLLSLFRQDCPWMQWSSLKEVFHLQKVR